MSRRKTWFGGRPLPNPFGKAERQSGRIAVIEPVEGDAVALLETDRDEDVQQALSVLPLAPCTIGGAELAAHVGGRPAQAETRDAKPSADLAEIGRGTSALAGHRAFFGESFRNIARHAWVRRLYSIPHPDEANPPRLLDAANALPRAGQEAYCRTQSGRTVSGMWKPPARAGPRRSVRRGSSRAR